MLDQSRVLLVTVHLTGSNAADCLTLLCQSDPKSLCWLIAGHASSIRCHNQLCEDPESKAFPSMPAASQPARRSEIRTPLLTSHVS